MLNGFVTESWLLLVALPRLRAHDQCLTWIVVAIIGRINSNLFRMVLVRADHAVRGKLKDEKRQENGREDAAKLSQVSISKFHDQD